LVHHPLLSIARWTSTPPPPLSHPPSPLSLHFPLPLSLSSLSLNLYGTFVSLSLSERVMIYFWFLLFLDLFSQAIYSLSLFCLSKKMGRIDFASLDSAWTYQVLSLKLVKIVFNWRFQEIVAWPTREEMRDREKVTRWIASLLKSKLCFIKTIHFKKKF
jgi:hypothetical protein